MAGITSIEVALHSRTRSTDSQFDKTTIPTNKKKNHETEVIDIHHFPFSMYSGCVSVSANLSNTIWLVFLSIVWFFMLKPLWPKSMHEWWGMCQ
jgi:hypothetical protein